DSVGEETQDVGPVVIKHVNNFPPELLPNIFFNEEAQAPKHEPTYLKLEVYLLVTRIYKVLQTNKYVWPEDEVFHKLSSWTFTFPSMIS
ncbi:hypothetical protein MKW92_006178, partial [Papaver armeniacum]